MEQLPAPIEDCKFKASECLVDRTSTAASVFLSVHSYLMCQRLMLSYLQARCTCLHWMPHMNQVADINQVAESGSSDLVAALNQHMNRAYNQHMN